MTITLHRVERLACTLDELPVALDNLDPDGEWTVLSIFPFDLGYAVVMRPATIERDLAKFLRRAGI